MRLFLYGTLLDPETLAARSGNAALAARLRPATLSGWRRVTLPGTRYPTLRRHRKARVQGAVLDVPTAALKRLAAYEGARYQLVRVVVATPKGKTAAHTWIASAATKLPWKE